MKQNKSFSFQKAFMENHYTKKTDLIGDIDNISVQI